MTQYNVAAALQWQSKETDQVPNANLSHPQRDNLKTKHKDIKRWKEENTKRRPSKETGNIASHTRTAKERQNT